MLNSNCQNLSFLSHVHTKLYLYKKNLLFSKYIFMFILEPNQLPHLWWCEEKPLLDRNVSTYIVNRTRTAVGYKTVRRTSKSSNWYCLHGIACKKLCFEKSTPSSHVINPKIYLWRKVENHKQVKKKYFIDSIHSFDKRKYLDSSRQYLKWTLWHTDRWKVFKMVTI